MPRIVEEFDSVDECNARKEELKKQGKYPMITSDPVPTVWKIVWRLVYHPENSRKKE